jgi:hypothetical protein
LYGASPPVNSAPLTLDLADKPTEGARTQEGEAGVTRSPAR